MKVVYNDCYGGFSVSHAAMLRYAELKGITLYPETGRFGFITYWTCPEKPKEIIAEDEFMRAPMETRAASNGAYSANTLSPRDFDRADPVLVQVVEELGEKANGAHARLRIEDIPAGTLWRIDEYDGAESVMKQSDYDWKVAV